MTLEQYNEYARCVKFVNDYFYRNSYRCDRGSIERSNLIFNKIIAEARIKVYPTIRLPRPQQAIVIQKVNAYFN